MKRLYCCLLLVINVYAMEDLEDLVPDFIPVEAKKESSSIIPEKNRIMASLTLMKIPFYKDTPPTRASCSKEINYNEDTDSETGISLRPTRIVCVVCNKTFTRKDSLLVHQRTIHEGVEKIPCFIDTCSSTFSNKTHLTRHIKRIHKLHPTSLKPWSEKKAKKNPRNYQTNNYQSLATRHAQRMPTRSMS